MDESGDQVKYRVPFALGYTRVTMVGTTRSKSAKISKSLKTNLSPDQSLQFDSVRGVIASNRKSACCGEYVPEFCTHRPSRHESYCCWKLVTLTASAEGTNEGKGSD